MKKSQISKKIIEAQIVSAFVTDGGGGNPAGVVLDADNLTDEEKLQVAAKVGLSETAFVSTSETEGFKLDFFTPNRRIAHCGHATVATFSYLSSLGRISGNETSKETVDGPRKILIDKGAAFMEQLAPKYRMASDWKDEGVKSEDILESLGLANADLDARLGPVLVNTGNNFVVVGVSSGEVLANLKPNFEKITEISEKLDLIGYYIFTTDELATNNDATARMFAPRYAIEEEAGTGMAAGPLASVLYDFFNVKKETLYIDQGYYMAPASPSLITVKLNLEEDEIQGIMAGGYGRTMKSLTIEI